MKDLKSIWNYAKNYAIKKGLRNDAEDFAQEATMKLQTGRRTSIENLFIDFIRTKYGRFKTKQKAKAKELLRYNTLDDQTFSHRIEEGAEYIVSLAEDLEGDDRYAFVLRYLWGFTAAEIAYCMGVTENAICQRLGKIKRELTSLTSV